MLIFLPSGRSLFLFTCLKDDLVPNGNRTQHRRQWWIWSVKSLAQTRLVLACVWPGHQSVPASTEYLAWRCSGPSWVMPPAPDTPSSWCHKLVMPQAGDAPVLRKAPCSAWCPTRGSVDPERAATIASLARPASPPAICPAANDTRLD